MEAIVPVLDFRKLSEADGLKKLREACEKPGCFRITNHTIPLTLMAEMKSVVKYLHDLPPEIKMRNQPIEPHSGYRAAILTKSPLYEGMGIYDMIASPQALEEFCTQLEVPPHYRQIIEKYGQAIHDLASSVSQKMAECLGTVDTVDFKDWTFILRTIKYNFTPENIGSMGVELHTDQGFMTLLQDDETVCGS